MRDQRRTRIFTWGSLLLMSTSKPSRTTSSNSMREEMSWLASILPSLTAAVDVVDCQFALLVETCGFHRNSFRDTSMISIHFRCAEGWAAVFDLVGCSEAPSRELGVSVGADLVPDSACESGSGLERRFGSSGEAVFSGTVADRTRPS